MKTFLKGIVVGLGAVAPGLSGSILLVIFGLYRQVVDTVSRIFKNFKKNLLFLFPLALGIGVGMLAFSKLIDLLLGAFPMQTHYAFLGLILGALPMLFSEMRKEGFSNKYYLLMAAAFAAGTAFFLLSGGLFADVRDPGLLMSVLLGFVVAASYLIPGVDSAAILSAFGLYRSWVDAVGNLRFSVLLPAAVGFLAGAVLISLLFHVLLHRWYTGTYSVVVGLFFSVILAFVWKDCPPPALDGTTFVSCLLLLCGFAASLSFGLLPRLLAKRSAGSKAGAQSDPPPSASEIL